MDLVKGYSSYYLLSKLRTFTKVVANNIAVESVEGFSSE